MQAPCRQKAPVPWTGPSRWSTTVHGTNAHIARVIGAQEHLVGHGTTRRLSSGLGGDHGRGRRAMTWRRWRKKQAKLRANGGSGRRRISEAVRMAVRQLPEGWRAGDREAMGVRERGGRGGGKRPEAARGRAHLSAGMDSQQRAWMRMRASSGLRSEKGEA